jgi:hypothetical protein
MEQGFWGFAEFHYFHIPILSLDITRHPTPGEMKQRQLGFKI